MQYDYLLNKKVKIYQSEGFYHASTDAVWLAAAVEKIKANDAILDVGSGTGAVALCLAQRFKDKKAQITGIDVQKELVEAANLSAVANDFTNVKFELYDIFKGKYKPCSFNHVISNPPYFSDDMPSPNKSKALAHCFNEYGLRQWIDFCIKSLKPQGRFYMINRAEMLEYIISGISGRLGKIEIFPIFSKVGDLKAKRVIVRAQKDNKTPLVICAPKYVHEADGKHSALAESILRKGEALSY